MKRCFDLAVSSLALLVLALPVSLLIAIVRLTSRGPGIYWSDRIGQNNKIFKMPKLRTMRRDTPAVATHLLAQSDLYVTPVGRLLRKTSLDELPQLYSVLTGSMSLVGPRPALFNQDDLVALRTQKGIHTLKPGLTGWAQINGRDELPIPIKVEFDEFYLHHRSFLFDVKIILSTFRKAFNGDGVSH